MKKVNFKNKKFWRLWISHALSQISNYLLLFVLLGRLFEITSSTVAISMLWIVYAIPLILLGPFSGSLIDCLSKKRVLITTNLLQALIIASYSLTFFWQKNYLVYSLLFIYSLINQFNNPAELAAIPNLVKKKNLSMANNILLFTNQASFTLGAALSGLLVKLFSPVAVILTAATATLLSGLNATFLPFDRPIAKINNWNLAMEEIFLKIKQGYQFIAREKLILYSFGLIVFFQIIIAVSALILPAFSSEILHLTAYDAGYLVAFPVACGLIGGTLILAHHQDKIRKKEWIGSGLSLMGIIIIIFAVIIAKMNGGQEILAPFLSFIAGLAAAITYAPCRTFVQEATPKQIRGRVFGTLSFIVTIATIPPSILMAMITELISIRWLLTLSGLIIFLLGVFILRKGNDVILAANHRS